MAKKFDSELLADARTENSKHKVKTENQAQPAAAPASSEEKTPDPEKAAEKEKTTPGPSPDPAAGAAPFVEPERDEFKEKFEEYFKGAGSFVAGSIIVEMIDDLKANFLYMYARKNKIDIQKDALKMDQKSKDFTAFLVDYAVKNNLFDWIKKYPLIAATGVVGLSAGSSFLMLQMLKGSNDEAEKLRRENEELRRKTQERNRREATDITPEAESNSEVQNLLHKL